MKKNSLYHITCGMILTVVFGLLSTSCDLTRKPTSSISLDESLETFQDAEAWNRGVYAQFRNRQGGSFVTIQERMGDCLNASDGFGNRGGDYYLWDEMSASDGGISTVYSYYYSTLKNVNKLLEGGYQHVIDLLQSEAAATDDKNAKASLEEEIEKTKEYLGSAYFARAFYFFNLLWRFSTPYNAATAKSDLGVPVVTVFNVSDQVKRGTVQEGYDQVFADLNEAEKYLKNAPNMPGSTQFNTDAITALRARAYLEMKDYENAYTEAQKLIKSNRYPLIEPTEKAIMNMWRYDKSSEFILVCPVSKTEGASSMGSYYGAYINKTYHSPDWLPTQGFIDKFAENDIRTLAYFEKVTVYYNNIEFKDITIISKFRGNPNLATKTNDYYGPFPNGQHAPKIFRIAEDYLIAAEAAYFTNKDALTPLNALRVSRGLAPLSGISGKELLQEIKDERLRELALEGFRLFDLRRWGDPMNRMPYQTDKEGSFLFLNNSKGLTLKIAKDNPRFTFPIPQYDINVYGEENMPQNPGW